VGTKVYLSALDADAPAAEDLKTMSQVDLLMKLDEWYVEQCDGVWEHGSGIEITSVDNPGWMVTINLRDTSFQDTPFNSIYVNNGKTDWLNCLKKDDEFSGAGDPSKLPVILQHFLTFVGKL
jgi:hypothetical protein